MSAPLWIKQMLQARGIPFEELRHHKAYTAQEVAGREHVSGRRMAKVVAALADDRFVEVILPANRRLDLERMKETLEARSARLASEQEMEKVFTDAEVGAAPPLRHWEGVEVLMDRSLIGEDDIVFQAGTHEDAIRVKLRDWFDLVHPQVATLSVAP
jgi:Ala-tRNA(Pro) deacylase